MREKVEKTKEGQGTQKRRNKENGGAKVKQIMDGARWWWVALMEARTGPGGALTPRLDGTGPACSTDGPPVRSTPVSRQVLPPVLQPL